MSYKAPASALADIKNTPYPDVWGDPALETIFRAQMSDSGQRNTTHGIPELAKPNAKDHKPAIAAIAGAAIGCLVLLSLVCIIGWLYRRRRIRRELKKTARDEIVERNRQKLKAKPASFQELEVKPEEMEAMQMHHEVPGDLVWPKRITPLYELPAQYSPRLAREHFT